jgi:hypothetical protein
LVATIESLPRDVGCDLGLERDVPEPSRRAAVEAEDDASFGDITEVLEHRTQRIVVDSGGEPAYVEGTHFRYLDLHLE